MRRVHLNFADEGFQVVEPYGKVVYRYRLEGSVNGRHWFVLADRSWSEADAPIRL